MESAESAISKLRGGEAPRTALCNNFQDRVLNVFQHPWPKLWIKNKKTMANIEEHYNVIEAAIQSLGVEPERCRDEKEPGAWAVMRGEQEIWIDCWHIEEEDRAYFQVLAPVLEVPSDMPLPFYREVLEINYNLFGVAFGIFKNMLALKVIREAEGLDETEALNTITRVGNYAGDFGPALLKKYFTDIPSPAPEDE